MKTDLTQERVKEIFDYDFGNGWLIRKKDRYGRPYNQPTGNKPAHADGYGVVKIDGKNYLTHRVIWLWHYGSWPTGETDHIDQNKMNNCINNLRDVSQSENSHNRNIQKNNLSGLPGVSWNNYANKYHARIQINNKNTHLGYFTNAEEAFLAYQLAKIKLHPTSPLAQEYYRELTLAG